MCGISALIFSNKNDASLIAKMNSLIAHRGPDGEGEKLFLEKAPYLALAHRRLSIIDLSPSGHQPMQLHNSGLFITYNGEIYNYLELRDELQAEGVQFFTRTDTEVILAAYQKWGVDCLHRFNGMFAFVIYDAQKRSIFAARDRFAVKPLYYWQAPGLIAFGSEIKQLTALPGFTPKLNAQRAYDFLNFALLDHTRETLFQDIFQLKGGEYLEEHVEELIGNKICPKKWYTLPESTFRGTYEDAVGRFKELFESSIELRLRSDVPVGSCLSGGLDSSAIVLKAGEQLKKAKAPLSQMSFTAGSEYPQFDESHFAKSVIDKGGLEAHFVIPSFQNLFGQLKNLVWHQDEPFVSTSLFAQWSVFELAKEKKIKVMLDGQGSDEQLGGYLGFFANHLFDKVRQRQWKDAFTTWKCIRCHHPRQPVLKQLMAKFLPEGLNLRLKKLLQKNGSAPAWIDLKKLSAIDHPPFEAGHRRSFQQESLSQLLLTSVPMLLHFEDRNSMAHGIESRTPFLDYRLVEFLASLPSEFKVGKGVTKQLLRDSLKDLLPENIYHRHDKMGFLTAEEMWLKKDGKKAFEQALKNAIDASQGILKPELLTVFSEIASGRRPFSFVIWRAISFGAWMEAFSIKL